MFDTPQQLTSPWEAEADRVYGKNGQIQHLRGNWLGCNPDYQQSGYARAVHEANIQEAERLGVKVIFGSCRKNVCPVVRGLSPANDPSDVGPIIAKVAIYKRIGGRPMGREIKIGYPIPPEYGNDWQYGWIMESGHTTGGSKL